ncbi:MAG: class I SAM-dependent methyltransferase [Ignavibacteria bacterium]|nr:class I SAM-dependent methyltransferase [Ignavibacteria bacterium]
MKLNRFEFLLMNNPIRAFIQEKFEVQILRKLLGSGKFRNVLEIGCGNGNGARLIKNYFAPENLIAIDIDEKMIKIAKKRSKEKNIDFLVMDAVNLSFPDKYFDAVFDFGVIHHIQDWRKCINEVHRVLKVSGKFVGEEPSIESFQKGIGKFWRIMTNHPYDSMFSMSEFTKYLNSSGFQILTTEKKNPFGLLKFFLFVTEKS